MKIAYQKEKTDIYEIKAPRKRGILTRLAISLFYSLAAFVSFGLIYWVFHAFKFPITSIVINIIFIALIVFAGTALRKRAQELTIEDDSESFLSFITDV